MRRQSLFKLAASVTTLGLCSANAAALFAADAQTPIPQPVVEGLKLAPANKRLDLMLPKFSNPTKITNPLFPASSQDSVVMVGKVDGKPFRTEVTLLPYTQITSWQGVQIEAKVSQYTAYLDGRLQEVAYDLYAQADDGSVWYLGEDVVDLKDGAIHTKEGTWQAGRDGPPAMIMPANPKPGDAFRAENMPGIAFEEITIKSTNETVDGPFGPVAGGLIVSELALDGSLSQKTFAPGYGEMWTGKNGEVEALALAVPANAARGPIPRELTELTDGANAVFKLAGAKDWPGAAKTVEAMMAAWKRVPGTEIPQLIGPQVAASLNQLTSAVATRNSSKARQAALEALRWSLDLHLRYRPSAEVNLARMDLWAAQAQIDAESKNAAELNGDVFSLFYIRDRIVHDLDAASTNRINLGYAQVQSAVLDEDFAAAAKAAEGLRAVIAGLKTAR